MDVEQAKHLVHSGQDGHLIGKDIVNPRRPEKGGHVFLNRLPIGLYFMEHVDFLCPEVVADLGHCVSKLPVKAIAQAVGRIGADNQGSVTELGRACRRRGGNGSLADPTFTGK